jgi:hypothetical protein
MNVQVRTCDGLLAPYRVLEETELAHRECEDKDQDCG